MADGPLTGAPINFPSAAAPHRPMFPVFTSGSIPRLAYQVDDDSGDQSLTVLGANLADLELVGFADVNVNGNAGAAPTPLGTIGLFGSLQVSFNAAGTVVDDLWGILLRDGDGNPYTPPSPIHIFT